MKIFYLFLISTLYQSAYASIYEACDWHHDQVAERIASRFYDSEYKPYCPDNNPLSITRQISNVHATLASFIQVPDECFVQAITSRKIGDSSACQYRVCEGTSGSNNVLFPRTSPRICGNSNQRGCYWTEDPSGQRRCVHHRRPCASQRYVQSVSKAYHEVMECLGLDPQEMFPLYYHEGQFRINAVSGTGAVCAGQLTAGTVETMNNLDRLNYSFYSGNSRALSEPEIDSLRLSQILNRCPKVKKHFTQLSTAQTDKGTPYLDGNKSLCEVVENPYTCFLYSALNHKRNLLYTRKIADDSHLYIFRKRNETLIFKTQEEYENAMRSKPELKMMDPEVIPIFDNPDEVATAAALWAYNGGVLTAKVLFPAYLDDVKSRKVSEIRRNSMRVPSTAPLSTKNFKSEFQVYIKREYRWPRNVTARRRNEVSSFVNNIISDAESLLERTSTENQNLCVPEHSFLRSRGTEQ